MLSAALKEAVPVRERPAPMTRIVMLGLGVDGWAPIVIVCPVLVV
jgi:hypothetical protein